MAQQLFTLDALKMLDFGIIPQQFNVEMQRCVADCMDRPGDAKARKVSIVFNMVPQSDSPGKRDCDKVVLEAEIQSSVPKRRTKIYTMTPNVKGNLLFNPDTPMDPDGKTIFDDQERDADGKSKGAGS